MGFARFIRLWIWGAIRRSVGLGDFIAGIVGNIITIFLHFYPNYETAMNDLIWQIPLYGLAAAMLYRLLITPYELWKDAEERAVSNLNGPPSPFPAEVIHKHVHPNRHIDRHLDRWRDGLSEQKAQRQRKLEATLANPVPNIGMKQALDWVTEKTKKEGQEAREELQDLASVGAIKVWGRSYSNIEPNPLKEIPRSVWSDHFMFWWDGSDKEDEHQGLTQHVTGFAHKDLKFCYQQIVEHYRK